MHLTHTLPLLVAAAVLTLGACDSGSTSSSGGDVAIVTGALSSEDGNQHVSEGLARADAAATVDLRAETRAVAVSSIDATGALTIVGTGTVDSDGRFTVADLPALAGPFVVEARGDGDVVLGSAIVPGDAELGATVISQPISQETTVETDVMLHLVRSGGVALDQLDTVALMSRISAELAADVSGDGEAGLADAAAAAQEAYVGVMAGLEGTGMADARAMGDARLAAWGELAAHLDQATGADADNDAWAQFDARVSADVAATTGASLDAMATAEAAASTAFAATADRELSTSAAAHAEAAASVHAAMADHAYQSATLAASSDASADLRTDLDQAYTDFSAAVRASGSVDAVGDAFVHLSATVSGQGMDDASASVLGRLVASANGGDTTAQIVAQEAIDAAADASAALRLTLTSARNSADVSATVSAFTTFHSAVREAVGANLGGSLSADVTAFVEGAAAQAGGSASAVLDLNLLDGLVDGGVTLSGTVLAILGDQSGADGLVSSASFDILGDAASSALLTADASGELDVVATGTVNATSGHVEIDGIASPTIGASFLAVRDATGQVLGMVHLDGGVDATHDVTASAITLESTVEAQVMLAIIADGHDTDDIDSAELNAMIDRAIAGAATTAADIHALASGVWLAQEVRATASANRAGDPNADAMATAQADAAFEATVAAVAGVDSTVFAAVDARAQLDNAAALEASVTAAFDAAGFGSARSTAVSAAVAALASATASAQSRADVELAGDAFQTTLTAMSGSGVLSAILTSDLELGATAEGQIATAVSGAMSASATFEGRVSDALDAATSASGEVDTAAALTDVTDAGDSLEASLDLSLDLSTVLALSPSERDAVSALVAQVAAGLYGSAGVE